MVLVFGGMIGLATVSVIAIYVSQIRIYTDI